jgi:hypothetical protein
MPFGIKRDTNSCSEGKPYAVYNTDTGEKKSCFKTRAEALKYQRALMANSKDTAKYSQAEIFFSSDSEEEDGLVWKDILVEGEWAYSPDASQTPVPIPIKVIAGFSEGEEIGMDNLIQSFEDKAFEDVTVPLTHANRPEENTGYVRKLRKVERDGKQVLRVGIEFTEEDIEGKVKRNSIKNTSAGLVFDYIRKNDGKVYRQALDHVNLTNRPWLTGLNASEDNEVMYLSQEATTTEADTIHLSADEVEELDLADASADKRREWAKNGVALSDGSFPITHCGNDSYSNGAARKRAKSGNKKLGTIMAHIRKREKALGCKSGGSNLGESQFADDINDRLILLEDLQLENLSSNDGEASDKGELNNTNGGINMDKPEDTSVATEEKPESDASAEEKPEANADTGISDEKAQELTALVEEQKKQIDEQKEQLQTMGASLSETKSDLHEKKVDERVRQLSEDQGFKTYPGLLKEIRSILLADVSGAKTLKLSEEKDGETVETQSSASEVVERMLAALPYEDGRVNFSDQALKVEDTNRPKSEPENNAAEVAESLGLEYPSDKKDGDE